MRTVKPARDDPQHARILDASAVSEYSSRRQDGGYSGIFLVDLGGVWVDDARIANILRQLSNSEPGSHVTLRALSKPLGLSERRLGRLFKQEFGMTFHHLVRNLRMTNAARVLRESSLIMKEIAFQTGYNATSNFSRDFKVEHGVSPREYRRSFNRQGKKAI